MDPQLLSSILRVLFIGHLAPKLSKLTILIRPDAVSDYQVVHSMLDGLKARESLKARRLSFLEFGGHHITSDHETQLRGIVDEFHRATTDEVQKEWCC